MTGRLFDAPAVPRRPASRALCVIVGCPVCGGPLTERTVETPALFIHGGYGATRRATWNICPNRDCRWSLERQVDEVRPVVRPLRLGRDTTPAH